jgi:hypothetical protein
MKDYKTSALNATRGLVKRACLKSNYFDKYPSVYELKKAIRNVLVDSNFSEKDVIPEGIDKFIADMFGILYKGFSAHFKKTMCKNY